MKEGEEITAKSRIFNYSIEGKKVFGPDTILLEKDDDLTKNSIWGKAGFTIEPFLDPSLFFRLKEGIKILITDILRKINVDLPTDFQLKDYHRYISDIKHSEFLLKAGKYFPAEIFPFDIHLIEERISEVCNLPLTCTIPAYGISLFNIRIVRPGSNDNNPLHKDVWLDHLRNAINIYVPIAGSNELSSLHIIPGSHYWKESEIERTESGAIINGTKFTVPAVTNIKRDFKIVRPDPMENEVLVFSPYILHGGAVNTNNDITRVSLEMRFWRKK